MEIGKMIACMQNIKTILEDNAEDIYKLGQIRNIKLMRIV